jgi:hypothetical protein
MRVLNVGGSTRDIPIPRLYEGWEHVLLDIDPEVKPDICLDARELAALEPRQFDAIYCSHNLDLYYAHDLPKVLAGFRHVLKEGGFAEIRLPDLGSLMRHVVKNDLGLDHVLYQSMLGPVRVRDFIYGFGPEIERSGRDFYAHKNGFTKKALAKALLQAGFATVLFRKTHALELAAIAFQQPPTPEQRFLFGIRETAAVN